MYLDANSLYRWAMSQALPTGGFKWTDDTSWKLLNDNSDRGLILEIDLEYPKELHDLHNGYSCAAKKQRWQLTYYHHIVKTSREM